MDTELTLPVQSLEKTDWTLQIEGLTCASCVAHLEKALLALPAVMEANVNLATEKASVKTHVPINFEVLRLAVAGASYAARQDEAPSEGEARYSGKIDLWPVVASVFLSLPLALPMIGRLWDADWALPVWAQFTLATPVQFVLGARFYRSGWRAALAWTGNMDLLVALETTAGYGLSVYFGCSRAGRVPLISILKRRHWSSP